MNYLKPNVVFVLFALFFRVYSFYAQEEGSFQFKDTIFFNPNKLDDKINSPYDDYGPVITADGLTIFYTSKRPKESSPTKKIEQIYVSSKESPEANWKPATLIPLKSERKNENISIIGISNDGQKILLYKGGHIGGDIYLSSLEGQSFTEPILLPEPINTLQTDETSAAFGPDGKTLYFVSDRPGGKGGKDIWISKLQEDGTWTPPQNIGEPINTHKDEEAIFIHPDGKTLYFSSKGHNSIGGYDIFTSQLKDGVWSKPLPLTPLNTKEDDLFFVLDASGTKAYYSRGTKGNLDLYEINIEYKKVGIGPRVALYKGKIIDFETQTPTEALIKVTNLTKNETNTFQSNRETGKYLISLPSGNKYKIRVTDQVHKDNLPFEEIIDLPDTASYKIFEKDIYLKKFDYINIKGTLLDQKTGHPLKKIKVTIKSKSGIIEQLTFTDESGFYEFKNLPSNEEYILEAEYEGTLLVKGKTTKQDGTAFQGFSINDSISDELGEYRVQLAGSSNNPIKQYLIPFSLEATSQSIFNNPDKFKKFVELYGDKEIEGLEYRIQVGAYTYTDKFEKQQVRKIKEQSAAEIIKSKLIDNITRYQIDIPLKTINEAIKKREEVRKLIPDAFIAPYLNGLRVIITQDALRFD